MTRQHDRRHTIVHTMAANQTEGVQAARQAAQSDRAVVWNTMAKRANRAPERGLALGAVAGALVGLAAALALATLGWDAGASLDIAALAGAAYGAAGGGLLGSFAELPNIVEHDRGAAPLTSAR